MSICRIAIYLSIVCLCACRTSTITFDKSQLNGGFIQNSFSELYPTMEQFLADSFKVDTVKYEAVFEQRLINIDNIGQYKLTNSLSSKKGVIPAIGSAHVIYLYFYINGGVEKVLFVSSYLNADRVCVSLGPAYTGIVSRDHIQLLKKYNIKRREKQFFLSDKHIQDVDIRMFADEKFRDGNGKFRKNIQINNVITKKDIHPAEFLVFDIPRIFQDSSALKFSIQN